MFALLPLIFLILIFMTLLRTHEVRRVRVSVIYAMVICGVTIVALSEVLGIFDAVTLAGIIAGWCAAIAVAGMFYWIALRRYPATISFPSVSFAPLEIGLLVILCLLCLIIALKALIVPPCCGDNMIYHSTRVVHWIQNRNVFHFPTQALHELYPPPWAEYASLHLQILWGGDRLSNVVQFVSMLGSLIAVTLIAAELGAGIVGQLFSAAFCATIPIGIMQASGAQTDYAASLWLAVFVFTMLRFRRSRDSETLIFSGLSLGLALLTKATNYLYAFPFFVWIIAIFWKPNSNLQYRLKPLLIAGSIVIALNAGFWVRNILLFHNPLGAVQENVSSGEKYINEFFSWRVLVSNIVRNAAIHVNSTNLAFNQQRDIFVKLLHDKLHLAPDDPRTSAWLYGNLFNIMPLYRWEVADGNPAHFLVIVACIAIYPLLHKIRSTPRTVLLVSVLGAAFLFCFFLKWQPVHSRLHLPLFVLFAPFVAVVVEHWPRLIVYSACGLLFILSVPDVFSENGKQLTGPQAIFSKDRSSMRLMYGSYYRKDYGAAIALIKKSRCREIGMIIEHDAWEYPLFAFLGSSYRIEHVNVDNVSTRTRNSRLLESFDPQLIVRVRALYSPNDRFAKPFTNVPVLAYHGNSYQREWSSDLIEIYARSNEPAFIGSLQ